MEHSELITNVALVLSIIAFLLTFCLEMILSIIYFLQEKFENLNWFNRRSNRELERIAKYSVENRDKLVEDFLNKCHKPNTHSNLHIMGTTNDVPSVIYRNSSGKETYRL